MMPRSKKKLPLGELTRRLDELATQLLEAHAQCETHRSGMLEHARRAGAALLEAKGLLTGTRGGYGDWQRRNFHGSPKTARLYVQVAKHWDEPKAKALRQGPAGIKSMVAYLRVLSGRKPLKERERPGVDKMVRDEIRKKFNERMLRLSDDELNIMYETFEPYLWPKLYGELRHLYELVHEDEADETDKRVVVPRMHEYLNRPRIKKEQKQ